MIDLFATDKLRQYYPRYQQLVQEVLIPDEQAVLRGKPEEAEALLAKHRAYVKKEGLWAPHLPEHEGGLGFSMLEFAQISEVLAHTPFGHYTVNAQAPDIGNMELLEKYASEPIKAQYLHPLMNGEIRSCFSMTEPEFAGSNPTKMGTMAVRDGDEYVINGHKWFTTAADGASFAVVMAITNPDAAPHERASMIIIPTDNAGFKFIRNIPIMGDEGHGYHSHAELRYEDCRVPVSNLVGEEGKGFLLAQERLGSGRIHHCMRWIGICERAFHLMCQRAATREVRDGQLLGQQQTIQNWIAESRASIDASRYMVLHAADKMDKEGAKAARLEISTIKFYVANVLMQVLDRAVQTHGALGITEDTILSFWYRHERGARIYDGPDEVHKASLAKAILKKYR